jgi:ribonucleoside-diphosphate reductase alpha chain
MAGKARSKTTSGTDGQPPDLGRPIELTDNARTVLTRRYLRKGPDGKPAESVAEMFWRVAGYVAKPEEAFSNGAKEVATHFYELLTAKRFLPNSPTFTGAGTPLGQLAACFVLGISDDMGRKSDGIFQTLRDAALIQQTGGGNGFSFSRLRPKGARVYSSGGTATGPIGFLRVYDQAFGEVAQGGVRRGANIAVLRVDHPDIREFITCKTDENRITNFNISVGVSDKFMRAVEDDADFDLINPQDGQVWETVRARELFDLIVRQAHHNGEPGVLFLDAANRSNPVPHLGEYEATNPCGEQFLLSYENCCLGSINLAQHVTDDGRLDWPKLQESVELATRFLDDVVEANAYVDAVPQLKEAARRTRRIGLGIMGLGDMMYRLGVRYGSEEAQEFAGQAMEFIRYHCMRTSVQLAQERDPFPTIEGSIYDPKDLKWTPPRPLFPYSHDWGRPELDWGQIMDGIKAHGIRNAAQTTVAPTGTIATVAGCEAYGCEPAFALAYVRHFNDEGRDVQLQYASPLFERALIEAGLSEEERRGTIEKVNLTGSCQDIEEVPAHIRRTFVVSSDVLPEEHVRMQAALQAFVDSGVSKTVNCPASTTEADVAKVYQLAWKLGCKGITVYVTGSREKVVLETQATAQAKESEPLAKPLPMFNEEKKPRPRALPGYTYRVRTPLGTAYVTVNENGDRQPFEVFMHTSKAGSETAAVSEALGRLISYILRLVSPVSPRNRLREVVRQLEGIGGGRSLGLGPNRVRSLPDGVAQVLAEHLERTDEGGQPPPEESPAGPTPGQMGLPIGDLCPECGEAALVSEEGCRRCYACGYSDC